MLLDMKVIYKHRMFPNISSLTIKYPVQSVCPFDISCIKNLHFLQIECYKLKRSKSFVKNIRLLSLLTLLEMKSVVYLSLLFRD